MELTNLHIAHHRNGISGVPFYVCTFRWHDGEQTRHMVATVFEEPGCIAVLDLDATAQDQIAFGQGNSWRGDHFERCLRIMIAQWEYDGAQDAPLQDGVPPRTEQA